MNMNDPKYLKYLDEAISEKEFQKRVEKIMGTFFAVYHTLRSKGSVPGFPDLVCIHRVTGQMVVMELKVKHGKLRDNQIEWLEHFKRSGADTYAIWPRHERLVSKIAMGEVVEERLHLYYKYGREDD